jgi:hypothetical protein
MKYRFLLLLAVLMSLGCTNKNPMTVAAQQDLQRPPADEIQLVLMHPSAAVGMNSATLYEVTGGEIRFIGVSDPKTSVVYRTTPGKHVFMVASDTAEFMEADLAGGKTYYGVVAPQLDSAKVGYSLWPFKNDPSADYDTAMPIFDIWVRESQLVEMSAEARSWYQEHRDDIEQKYLKFWPIWQTRTPAEIAKRSLSPEDGM